MRYLTYSATELAKYPVCLLVPSIRKDEIKAAYIDSSGFPADDLLVMDLHYTPGKKTTSVAEMKQYIHEELTPVLEDLEVEYLLVADSGYFKALTKATKIDANVGYVMDSPLGPWKVIYVPNYRAIFYDPEKVRAKIDQAMTALKEHRAGAYQAPGNNIIKFTEYPKTDAEIALWLEQLLEMNCPLSIDIEAFSLKHNTAGLGTMTICWSKHEGIAFPIDYVPIEGATEAPYGYQLRNEPRRELLRWFFARLAQPAIYHHIAYDVYVLIYQLYMKDILDTDGLLSGMEIMLRDWHCTKLITYLATNSCAGNKLGLKLQAQEFAGNYAVDEIKDITRIPLDQLLQYNLVDGLSTWFVLEKHWDTMVADDQLPIYQDLFQPSTLDIIQMQLTGLPMNMPRVKEVKAIFEADQLAAIVAIEQSPVIQQYLYRLREQHVAKRNAKMKVKRITLADPEVALVKFNPNSGPQLQDLLFSELGLPVLGITDNKEPSTDGETIESLRHHTTDQDIIDFLNALIDYKTVNKLLTSFIPAFENAAAAPDGWHYLFGNFNLGGTLSGRLSSSDPNLQNLPSSNSKGKMKYYVKLIKSCFEAPPGWLFCGLDFNSLEDKISAVTTKDPNKIKVYTDGYDGHSLRAFSYFGDQMMGIVDTVASINSIQSKYKDLRQDSKVPTFLLTYDGTYKGMMEQCGFDIDKAKMIEARYHELYVVSDQWKKAKLDQASKDGYVTVAFGLRVRTPLLKQVIRGNSKTPFEAEAEGRSAGNALGQSWCLLNNRAGVEFNRKVRASRFRLDIRPTAHIHDAQYFLIRDDMDAVVFTNTHLVKAVEWQAHPDIAHPDVKLGGELSVFFPHWGGEITIPNGANAEQISVVIEEALNPPQP